jgi:hypothetical protein
LSEEELGEIGKGRGNLNVGQGDNCLVGSGEALVNQLQKLIGCSWSRLDCRQLPVIGIYDCGRSKRYI